MASVPATPPPTPPSARYSPLPLEETPPPPSPPPRPSSCASLYFTVRSQAARASLPPYLRRRKSSDDDDDDPKIERRLLELANALARDLGRGQVNLGFEEDPPELEPEPEPEVQRPHSIAVVDGTCLLRSSAGNDSQLLDRPVSAGPRLCYHNDAFERLHPRRATVVVPCRGESSVNVETDAEESCRNEVSSTSSGSREEIDWSWVANEARRLERASMRRLQPFCPPPPPPPEPLPPLGALAMPSLEASGRSSGVDFPRRYSSRVEAASPAHSSSSADSRASRTSRASQRSSSGDSSDNTQAPDADGDADADASHNRPCDDGRDLADDSRNHWPHNLSCMFALMSCTLGLFNICRFAVFSILFGANFILQFLLLTFGIGIPLFTVQTSLGQFLGAGVMDMWRISPIFQGIGIALLLSQALIGIYSMVGVSWIFIYFRDSFITTQDRYRWSEPFDLYREGSPYPTNGSYKLEETVPDYLNGVVLQRHNFANSESAFGHLKFQVTFNLAVVWMIIFVSLSKGLRSYGKVVYVFQLFPVCGMLILCTKILGLTATTTNHRVFPETAWSEFFFNSKSWIAAASEVFFTWGALGASVMQITSHNRQKHLLQRDVSCVTIITIAILMLAAFLANTCVQLLAGSGYTYIPSSFENMSTVTFLQSEGAPLHPVYARHPVRYMQHSSLIVGTRVLLPGMGAGSERGYQVLRLATELAPSTFALVGPDQVSPFWAVLFYFVLILFGIGQQLAIWHCVITGIMAIKSTSLKAWETTITFFSCACGFVLGLPMTTELGIHVVYFLDFVVGSGWWLMVLYVAEILAVFMLRGRPCSGETVITTLFSKDSGCLKVWVSPILVFSWNVILPIVLMVLCIVVFKNGHVREIYNWHSNNHDYWPLWVREVGVLLQIVPILTIPIIAFVQIYRYMKNGPPDFFDRIIMLYRPPLDPENSCRLIGPSSSSTNTTNNATLAPPQAPEAFEDPPPKYTPPPSYTTATGARIAKLLRQSFRRSVRRITQVLGESNAVSPPAETSSSRPPPPDYAAVLVEMNQESVGVGVGVSTMTAADVAHVLRSSVRRPAKVQQQSTSVI